jgi:hypothetical protein
VALIWNDRQFGSPFQIRYEAILEQYAVDYQAVKHTHLSADMLAAFFQPSPCR